MKIILASSNPGKIHELQQLLIPYQWQVESQADFHVREVPETGLTFVENAIIKARHACRETNFPAIADDSGLQVASLHGEPGIYSSRYAGKNANADENIKKLLIAMQDMPPSMRKANFYCVLVYLTHAQDPAPLICEGRWEGTILNTPVGTHGFGYDPIFFDPKENCSAAELALTKKNQISHRGKALKLLIERLSEIKSIE